MENLTDWTQIAIHSLVALGQKVMSELPNVLGALFLVVFGWIVAKVLAYVVGRFLRVIRFDKLSEKLNTEEVLEKANINMTPSQIVAKFVYWVIILLFFVTASDTLGWNVVSESISDLIVYLPKLFSGVVIFIIGLYIANFVRSGFKGIFDGLGVNSGTMVSSFAFYLVVVIITLTALTQAGVDTSVITSNVTLIIGGIMLAFAVSFGIAAKDVLANILSSFYSRNNFAVGQKIEISGISGEIEKVDSTSVILKTTDGKIIIPSRKLLNEDIKIKS